MKESKNPFIVPVFIPHQGCPHRCAFCNQRAITSQKGQVLEKNTIRQYILKFIEYNRNNRPSQIAFFGGNFLGLPENSIIQLLELSETFVRKKLVNGIRFSTRPDTITSETLELIKPYSVSDIEIGAQSMENHVLTLSIRGHCAEDTVTAVRLIKPSDIRIGIQMMIGLPGENSQSHLVTAKRLAKLYPDYVRIYPTVIFKNSLLDKLYHFGKYRPLSLNKAVSLAKETFLLFLSHDIPVIRMGLQANQEFQRDNAIVDGPYHPAFGHLVYSEIFLDASIKSFENLDFQTLKVINVCLHPINISKFRGLNNDNITFLCKHFELEKIDIFPNTSLPTNGFLLEKKWVPVF